FLPEEAEQAQACVALLERVVAEEGQALLGWRRVPVDQEAPGPLARTVLPQIRQVFIGAAGDASDQDALERKLYVIRKRVEQLVRSSGMPHSERFYVPSLSSRTIVYKGLLQPQQIPAFYHDLSDPLLVSALALIHQPSSPATGSPTRTTPSATTASWSRPPGRVSSTSCPREPSTRPASSRDACAWSPPSGAASWATGG